MKAVGGFLDTRTNNEDFAITPCLVLVWVHGESKIYGLGIVWGWYSLYIGIGFNLPKGIKRFTNFKYKRP